MSSERLKKNSIIKMSHSIAKNIIGLQIERYQKKGATLSQVINRMASVHFFWEDIATKDIIKDKPVILIANHRSAADFTVLSIFKERSNNDVHIFTDAQVLKSARRRATKSILPLQKDQTQNIGSQSHLKSTAEVLRKSINVLREGGSLVIFPAASIWNEEWHSGLGFILSQLIKQGLDDRCYVVMVNIEDTNKADTLKMLPGITKIISPYSPRMRVSSARTISQLCGEGNMNGRKSRVLVSNLQNFYKNYNWQSITKS